MKKAKTTKRSKYASQIDLESVAKGSAAQSMRMDGIYSELKERILKTENSIVRLCAQVTNQRLARYNNTDKLRRQIATHMLQGMLASGDHRRPPLSSPAVLAQMAYTLADALIAEGRE